MNSDAYTYVYVSLDTLPAQSSVTETPGKWVPDSHNITSPIP